MREVKAFGEFIKKGIVKRAAQDSNRAISLNTKAERKKDSLKERLDKIGITDKNSEDYIESCYDIIMLLIRAKMISEGYNASGLGAHEAEVSYLRNLGFAENDVQFADQLRFFRNGMLYYGTALDAEYANKVLAFLDKIYPKLK